MSMGINSACKPELWAGMECTINRVGDSFMDQLSYAGHYARADDLQRMVELNIKALRYPVLWEYYQPNKNQKISWDRARREIEFLHQANVKPIVGLLHHGSGPRFTNLLDRAFPEKFRAYAQAVATEFPDVESYTPINEPLTTARFSGLYGLWYPHHTNPTSFAKAMLNQVKATVLAMEAIREINPNAKLVQTEDLGKTHSSPRLRYQAKFENERRWLTFDLLCGALNRKSPLWKYLVKAGVAEKELEFFREHTCPPHIVGLNYYVTSERYIDEKVEQYPTLPVGGNGRQRYIDTEAVRASCADGLPTLLREAWERFHLPMAITEAHICCTREEQMRWLRDIWNTACKARSEGIEIKAVTAWTTFGAYDWDSLLTRKAGHYESGAFDVRNGVRPTALAKMISGIGAESHFDHPLLLRRGWWDVHAEHEMQQHLLANESPILIVGKNGTLATAFSKICKSRNVGHVALSRTECNIMNETQLRTAIDVYKPWAVINTCGFVNVDAAETSPELCDQLNVTGPAMIARICHEKGIRCMTFSSDLVFDGTKPSPYIELDRTQPLNEYGRSKSRSEKVVSEANPEALIVRTSAFFGPWDKYNFAFQVLDSLAKDHQYEVVDDVIVSPTYVPDLVHAALDLLIDEASGIWHIANDGYMSWAQFAHALADRKHLQTRKIVSRSIAEMNWRAPRPKFSAITSNKGITLPSLDHAIDAYIHHTKL
jgi:dTDP-4-dehydrorhamnose reductase